MAKTRAVVQRIRSVRSIAQITHAMELVASARLRRAQSQVEASRPYAHEIATCLGRLIKDNPALAHPLFTGRRLVRTLLVVLSTDRGLCGGYNVNVLRKAAEAADCETVPCAYLVVGKKGRDVLRKQKRPIVAEFVDAEGIPTYREAENVTRVCVEAFLNATVDRVVLVFTRFRSVLKQEPVAEVLLPVQPQSDLPAPATAVFYEPNLVMLVERLVSAYTTTTVYHAMIDAFASEFAARRLAMKSATENAGDFIERLTLLYNRARQGAITQELSEIVGGASALS